MICKWIFGMAIMPFLCTGHLLNLLNPPRVNLWLTLKSSKVPYYFPSFLIPYLNNFQILDYTKWVAWQSQATKLDPQKNNPFIL